MARNQKKRAEERLLTALACGATVEAAARQCGVSESTAYRRLQDPAFQGRLHELRADLVQRSTSMLTAAGLESIKTLLELQKPAVAANVRLGAARAVLELGLKLRERDLESRVLVLEQRFLSEAA